VKKRITIKWSSIPWVTLMSRSTVNMQWVVSVFSDAIKQALLPKKFGSHSIRFNYFISSLAPSTV
jgi:hypothetical protein